jgi:hypothetical protein
MYNLNYTPTALGVENQGKSHLGVREQKGLNTTDVQYSRDCNIERNCSMDGSICHNTYCWYSLKGKSSGNNVSHCKYK